MNKPTLYMLVGLPGSGKSSVANKYGTVFSSDAIREELSGDVNNQNINSEVFQTLHRRIKDCLKSGCDCVYDATNIKRKRRMAFLRELKHIECHKVCIVKATPYEICLRRNWMRNRKIPDDVIAKMYMNWQTPYYFEGWDEIRLIYESGMERYYGDPMDYVSFYLNEYDQENKYHSFSLGKHLYRSMSSIDSNLQEDKNSILRTAVILHDIGKPFTKFKSEDELNSHYYQHENVSAYDSLFYSGCNAITPEEYFKSKLRRSILINLHMFPYQWEKDKINGEKSRNKYRKMIGEELYADLMLLHEADRCAHSNE